MTDEIQLVLDLTNHHGHFDDLNAFVPLWKQVDAWLSERVVAPGNILAVEHVDGPIRLQVISSPPQTTVSPATPLSVHAVLQAPRSWDRCHLCQEKKGSENYGPHRCVECPPDEASVCDKHVVMLEGKLDAYCNEHAPKSPSGEWATFWCFGPDCGGEQAWSSRDRAVDHREIGLPFCKFCYDKKFPECWGKAGQTCDRIGTLTCEHIDPDTEQVCARRICSTHTERWQIYGPHDEGLSLCQEHGAAYIDSQNVEGILFQIAASSANRLENKRFRSRLPTLPAVKHSVLKALGEVKKLQDLHETFQLLVQGVSTPFQEKIRSLINRSESEWQKQIAIAEQDDVVGLGHFERVVEEYKKLNLPQVAESLRYSDYRPKPNILFVLIDEDRIGMFKGKGGWAINTVQNHVNVTISLEQGLRKKQRK